MMWNVLSQVIGTGFKVMKTRSETKQMQALAEQKHYEKMVEGKIQYEVAKQNAMDNSWRDEWFYSDLVIAVTDCFWICIFQ